MVKKLVLLVTVSVMMLGINGCTQNKQGGDSSKIQLNENADVTIEWWAFPVFFQEEESDPSGTYEKEVIEAFEKEHKNIKVNLTMLQYSSGDEKLRYSVNNNKACDVLFDAPGRIMTYAHQNKLVDLNSMFTDDFVSDVDNQSILNSCMLKDKAYMYPISTAPFYMVFNKEYLEDAGVADLVKEGWTTEDFIKVAKALHRSGYVSASVFCGDSSGDQGTRAFISNLYDSSVINKDMTAYEINDENGKKGFRLVKDMVENGYMRNGSFRDATNVLESFVEGNASFTLLWGPNQQLRYSYFLKANNIQTVEVPYPSEDGVPELEYLVNGFCVFNNQDQNKINASKQFIDFICNDKNWGKKSVELTGCIPVRKSQDIANKELSKISNWTKYYSEYYNDVKGFSDMRVLWYENLQAMLDGCKSPDECADDFVSAANKTLSDKMKRK